MGCVIPHQSNAVNIPHQTNAGLIPCTESETYAHVGLRDGGPVFRAPLCINTFWNLSWDWNILWWS